jgi:hypothetical protein
VPDLQLHLLNTPRMGLAVASLSHLVLGPSNDAGDNARPSGDERAQPTVYGMKVGCPKDQAIVLPSRSMSLVLFFDQGADRVLLRVGLPPCSTRLTRFQISERPIHHSPRAFQVLWTTSCGDERLVLHRLILLEGLPALPPRIMRTPYSTVDSPLECPESRRCV